MRGLWYGRRAGFEECPFESDGDDWIEFIVIVGSRVCITGIQPSK